MHFPCRLRFILRFALLTTYFVVICFIGLTAFVKNSSLYVELN